MAELSMAQRLALLSPEEREEALAGLDPEALLHDWALWRRESQTPPPGAWALWLFMAGRGAGKTRSAAEWVNERVRNGHAKRIAFLGRTAADVRDVMIQGDALALDTVVPTPDGWTTMGEIRAGDRIIGGDGNPCTVLEAYAVTEDRPCYRVTFKSGATVIADERHKWFTWDWSARVARSQERKRTKHVPNVRTTRELADTLMFRNQRNHAVEVVGARFEDADAELPVAPYALGIWLGDGRARGSEVTLADKDAEHILSQIAWFHPVTQQARQSDRAACAYSIRGIMPSLRAMGVLRSKHIPLAYLRASYVQRMALLQGLMDSDGHVGTGAQCEISTIYPQLRDDLVTLICSLGIKVGVQERGATTRPAPRGVAIGKPSSRIMFLTEKPVASLDRHLARLRVRSPWEQAYDYVSSVEPVESVPVRCIRVDSPDHLFMVTDRYIPTHNSGVIATARPGEQPVWEPSKRRVTWPNGAHALAFSADEPDQLRGPQFDTAWCDEFASFPNVPGVDGLTAFANLRLGLRLPVDGDMPRMVATTTPRRVPSMFQLLEESENPEFGIVVTHATTYDNLANLASSFRSTILGLYEGTRIGQQELMGEMLHDIEGALFLQSHLDAARVTELPTGIKMHTVVGVDPSVAERPKDEAGIVVVKGTAERDFFRRHLYVVEDATVLGSPAIWAKRVVDMAVKWGAPVVAEGNQGGELVRMAIGQVNSNVPVYIVHAKAGKATRAEPVAALAEQGRLHMFNYLPLLESEITSWVPAESRMSPGRLDAMVWGALALTTKVRGATFATSTSLRARSMAHHRLPQLNAANLSKRSPYKGVRR